MESRTVSSPMKARRIDCSQNNPQWIKMLLSLMISNRLQNSDLEVSTIHLFHKRRKSWKSWDWLSMSLLFTRQSCGVSENAENMQIYSILQWAWIVEMLDSWTKRWFFIVVTSNSHCYCCVKCYLGENLHYNTVQMTFFSYRLFLWLSRSFTSIKNLATS